MTIDLNKMRASRLREAKRKPVELKFGKGNFKLPAELPMEVISMMTQFDGKQITEIHEGILSVLRVLFGSQFDEFMSYGPSVEDVEALTLGLSLEYGISSGESPASATP